MAKSKVSVVGARPKAIVRLQDSPSEGKNNWLIYADSGVGKTVLAGTAENSMFLTVEAAGTESAKALGSSADELVCNSWVDLAGEYYNYFKHGSGCSDYEWLLLDSISEMEELCWTDQLEAAHKRNKSRSLFQPAIQDYQIVGNKMKRMIDQFNRLPINVLYTAQTMRIDVEDTDNDDDTTKLMPLVGSTRNGVVSQKICGKVTLVGLLQERPGKKKKDTVRRLWLQGGKRYIAKDRHDTFPMYVDNTTIPAMAAAVEARQKSVGSATPKNKEAG